MSKEHRNIEDLFKSTFDNQKVEPNISIWNNIDSKLNKLGFSYYIKNSFNSFKSTPSANLWTFIAFKIWLFNFVRFNILRFNLYYLILLSSSIIYLINYDFATIVKTEITSDIFKVADTKLNIDLDPEIVVGKNIQVANSATFKKIEKLSIKIDESSNNLNISHKNKLLNEKKDIPKNDELDIKTPLFSETELRDESIIKVTLLKPFLTSDYNLLNKISYYDTLGINAFGDPILLKRKYWSIDIFSSFNNSVSTPYTTNFELTEYCKIRYENQEALNSFGGGININYQINSITFQTGLHFSQLGEKYKFYNTQNYVDSVSYHFYQSGARFTIDSTLITTQDSINPLDTNYSYSYSISWIMLYDTLRMLHIDSLKENLIFYRNKYRYIEIPLTLGYQTNYRHFTFGFNGGLIAGLFINVKGRTLDYYDYNKTQDLTTSIPEIIPNISSYVGFSVLYKLNQKTSVYFEPYYKQSLNSIYSKLHPINQKFYSYGAKLGLRYQF